MKNLKLALVCACCLGTGTVGYYIVNDIYENRAILEAEEVRQEKVANLETKEIPSANIPILIGDDRFDKSKLGIDGIGSSGSDEEKYKSHYTFQFNLKKDIKDYDFTIGKLSDDKQSIILYPTAGNMLDSDNKNNIIIECKDVCTGDELVVASDKDGNYIEAYQFDYKSMKEKSIDGVNVIRTSEYNSASKLGLTSLGTETSDDLRDVYSVQFGYERDITDYNFTFARESEDGKSFKLYPKKGKIQYENNGQSVKIECDEVCLEEDLILVTDSYGRNIEAYAPVEMYKRD